MSIRSTGAKYPKDLFVFDIFLIVIGGVGMGKLRLVVVRDS